MLAFTKNIKEKDWFYLAVILLFCYLSFALPLQIMGLPSGFDMLTDIRFATALQDAVASGRLFPSWANDNLGFGSIGIRFYPPLSLYILALTQFVTNDWFTAFVTNFYLWMVIGCAGMFLFVKEWGTSLQGLIAALLYAVVPQHLNELFQFFMFAEFAVWGVLPFCFLFVTRICRGGTWRDTFLFALSYSVLILTHLPTTIIVSLCLPVYVLFLTDWRMFRGIFVHLLSAIVLTLLATSFRWAIVVNEFNWLAHSGPEHYASGYYDYSRWLFPNVMTSRSLFIFVVTSWLFDISILLTVSLMVPALLSLFRTRVVPKYSVQRILIASLVTALLAFFMLSRPSILVWDNLILLQRIQFPWRWLSVLSLLCVLLFSLSVPLLISRFGKFKRLIAYPALGVIFAIVLFDITQIIIPSAPVPTAELPQQIEEKLKTEPMWKGWWPMWARETAFENRERVIAGTRSVEIASWNRETKEFVVQPGESINANIQLFYYPLWKVTVNGQPAEIGKDENGAVTVRVPSELSKVRLYFEEPKIYTLTNVVSIITWLFPIFLLVGIYARKYLASVRIKPLLDKEYDYP